MYTTVNFKTKKALKTAIAAGQKIGYYQPGPFGGNEPRDGSVTLEGPYGIHKWYATAKVADGYIVSVK